MRDAAHGGVLVLVLLVCMLLSAFALYFAVFVNDARIEANNFTYKAWADEAADSARQHALALLAEDLHEGAADSFLDSWWRLPRARRDVADRSSYVAGDLAGQRWFEVASRHPDLRVRYRFKLADASVGPAGTPTLQPFVAAAWKHGEWYPTDDINAVDLSRLAELIARFDERGTNSAWLSRVTARLADARDANHVLTDAAAGNTEGIGFARICTRVDERWCHLDDQLRLGRYYEERPHHNFFLVDKVEPWYNSALGRTNVAVTLDREPMGHVAGWDAYRDLRARGGLPRWYPGMWGGVVAATGSGLPEPEGLFKYQPVVSNSPSTLYFDDDRLERFLPKGGIRQTVTFDGWFSSLNENLRARLPDARERGAFVTCTGSAPDCVILTNVPADTRYRVSLCSGNGYPHPLTARASFFGLDELAPLRFRTNGVARLRDGMPVDVRPLLKGGQIELVIRAPQAGVSPQQPFYLESALLEQPELIELYNGADTPVCVRGWRLAYRCGELMFWTAPLTTAQYYRTGMGRVDNDTSPVIPPGGRLIVTPDAALLDWFAGVNQNGRWGDVGSEATPVIELGQAWGPVFHVARARPARSYRATGPSNREYEWETDWRMELPSADWRPQHGSVAGDVVWFDPDGANGPTMAAPGMVVDQERRMLTVRMAGTRRRFHVTGEASLRFNSIPDTVREFWVVDQSGDPVARMLRDTSGGRQGTCMQTLQRRDGRFEYQPFTWSGMRSELAARHGTRYGELRGIRNALFGDTVARHAAVATSGISDDAEWYTAQALYLPAAAADRVAEKLHVSTDRAQVMSGEGQWLAWDAAAGIGVPEGAPGPLWRTAYIEGKHPVAVEWVGRRAIALARSPGLLTTQVVGQAVTLGPQPEGGGLHLFGEPGSVVLTWPTVPADEPVHVTLAGRTAREWTPVPTYAAWRRTAASRISVDVWNPDIRRFEPLVTDRTFDASDRLYLGRVPAEYLRTGRLCLRVRTHTSLSPATDALWLGGVFVHPHPERHYLNVNLLPPRSVSILCQSNVAAATTLLSKLQRTPSGVPVCTSLLSLGQALRAASAHARVPADRCSVRTDVFRLDVEAEVVRGSGTNTTVLAHTRREWEIDRSGIRLAPGTVARSQLPATMY